MSRPKKSDAAKIVSETPVVPDAVEVVAVEPVADAIEATVAETPTVAPEAPVEAVAPIKEDKVETPKPRKKLIIS
jgi:hypothetical protein